MTDEEFIRYCAEVMGYKWGVWAVSIMPDNNATWEGWKDNEGIEIDFDPTTDLNQMADVFDKLWKDTPTFFCKEFFNSIHRIGIAKAMREFIESAAP